jgi:tellurite resistance protein
MAACALAAVADGEVSFGERIRVDQILDTLEELKVFDAHEAIDLFDDFTHAILAAPEEGRARAVAAVRQVTDDRERAELLVRICLAVAEVGGEKKLVDQIEIVILCSLLGIEPRYAGLYTADGSGLLDQPES